MDILQTLLSSASGGAVEKAGQQLGLSAQDAQAAVSKLLPALAGGMQRNLGKDGGLQQLQRALSGRQHERFLDDPEALQASETREEGNAILGHLLGSKETSRTVAARAAEETGLDVGKLKQFLPIVAAAAMGAVSKQSGGGSDLGGLGGLLSKALGSAGGSDALGGLLSLGKKLF